MPEDDENNNAQGMSGVFKKDTTLSKEDEVAPGTTPTTPLSGPTTIGTGASAPSQPQAPKQQKAGTGTFANLKSYLQAAQGGGRVAQAATQRVQKATTGAEKGISQAQQTFGQRMGAGSGALFQGTTPGQYLTEEQASQAAQAESARILGAATSATYQAPQAAAVTAEEQAPAQPVQQPQQYFDPKDIETYSNIINAQYQGPMSLQQAGLYEPAARRAQTAQQLSQQAQTAGGRELLLRDIFGKTRDYSRGQSKLDALLLNTSQQGVQQLQQEAQKAGAIQQQLQQAQNLSANEAAQRAAAIEGISSGARGEFTTARTEEEKATEDYIQNIQANWEKLPEHFKKTLTEAKSGSNYNLSAEEAKILGLTPGQALFGVTPESIQAAQKATGAELITKDQLSRQLALAQLAGLDRSRGLQKDLMYSDLEKAGTKDILSSLQTDNLRKIQEENRTAMEKKLNERLYFLSGGGMWVPGVGSVNMLDVLKTGGYNPLNMEGLVAEGQTQNLLKNIAEGGAYSPTEDAKYIPSYLEKAYQTAFPYYSEGTKKYITDTIKSQISPYGGTDTTQVVENEQTKARAAALRQLLSEVYK